MRRICELTDGATGGHSLSPSIALSSEKKRPDSFIFKDVRDATDTSLVPPSSGGEATDEYAFFPSRRRRQARRARGNMRDARTSKTGKREMPTQPTDGATSQTGRSF